MWQNIVAKFCFFFYNAQEFNSWNEVKKNSHLSKITPYKQISNIAKNHVAGFFSNTENKIIKFLIVEDKDLQILEKVLNTNCIERYTDYQFNSELFKVGLRQLNIVDYFTSHVSAYFTYKDQSRILSNVDGFNCIQCAFMFTLLKHVSVYPINFVVFVGLLTKYTTFHGRIDNVIKVFIQLAKFNKGYRNISLVSSNTASFENVYKTHNYLDLWPSYICELIFSKYDLPILNYKKAIDMDLKPENLLPLVPVHFLRSHSVYATTVLR